jgi:AsmA protein
MKKAIKWTFIIGGSLVVLIIAALILIPMFVDIQKYKPRIETEVAKATGRTFMLGGDLNLSLFPWARLSFSDLHLGNPAGFEEKDFVSIESFDVRVKLLPLLFKDIQVKRFILKGTRIVLETSKDGRVSWEFRKKSLDDVSSSKTKKSVDAKPAEGFFLKALAVGEFSITDGAVIWLDHAKKERKEISDVTLVLKDISLDRPVHLTFSAHLDKRPFSLEGDVGPLGKEFGRGTIPLTLFAKALDQLDVSLKGYVTDPATRPRFDLDVRVSPFSPRKLIAELGMAFPVSTNDPKTLNQLALKATVKGDTQAVSVSNGVLDLDESKLNFTAKAGDFSKPNITFDFSLDNIDLDRYLPPPSEEKLAEKDEKVSDSYSNQKKTDHAPLRRLVLNGVLQIGNLKIKNAKIENIRLKIIGKKGIFNIDPLAMAFYQGNVGAKASLNVQKDTPISNFQLTAKGIQSGPLLMDVLNKDILEGVLKANINLNMTGDDAAKIKKSLNGNGNFLFKDGAIKGIDLAGMVRNVKATFGLAEASEKKPRTDFAELNVPFTITRGIVNTSDTSLKSPLIRVTTAGKADLVSESLDFRVEPKFVTTIKGQGDTTDRSGLMVPVLVTGTFSSPKFRPDLEGMFKQKIEKVLPDLKKKLLEGDAEKGELKPLEKKVKELFKGFGSGQ